MEVDSNQNHIEPNRFLSLEHDCQLHGHLNFLTLWERQSCGVLQISNLPFYVFENLDIVPQAQPCQGLFFAVYD